MADYDKLTEKGGFKCPGCRDLFWTERQFEQHLSENRGCKLSVDIALLRIGICPLGVLEVT